MGTVGGEDGWGKGGWVGGESGQVGGTVVGWMEKGDHAHHEKFYGGGPPHRSFPEASPCALCMGGHPPHNICTPPYENSNSMGGSPPIENPGRGTSGGGNDDHMIIMISS